MNLENLSEKSFTEEKNLQNQIQKTEEEIEELKNTKENLQNVTDESVVVVNNFIERILSLFGGYLCNLVYESNWKDIEFETYLDIYSTSQFGLNTVLNWIITSEDYQTLQQRNSPPSEDVEDGEKYFIGDNPSGLWSDYSRKIAIYSGGSWVFQEPLFDFTKSFRNSYLIERRENQPPSADPDVWYLIGDSPVGDWNGYSEYLTFWDGSDWQFYSPEVGDLAYSDKTLNGYLFTAWKWEKQQTSVVHAVEEFNYSFDHIYKPVSIGNGSYGIVNKIKLKEDQLDVFQEDLRKLKEGQKVASRVVRRRS